LRFRARPEIQRERRMDNEITRLGRDQRGPPNIKLIKKKRVSEPSTPKGTEEKTEPETK